MFSNYCQAKGRGDTPDIFKNDTYVQVLSLLFWPLLYFYCYSYSVYLKDIAQFPLCHFQITNCKIMNIWIAYRNNSFLECCLSQTGTQKWMVLCQILRYSSSSEKKKIKIKKNKRGLKTLYNITVLKSFFLIRALRTSTV